MAFDMYFRAESKDAPYQQIFLSSEATDAAIAALLLQSLPPAPESGVFKASFRPGGSDGQAAVTIQRVADYHQNVALIYAAMNDQGQPIIDNVHLDPPATRLTAEILQALAFTAAKELADAPPNAERWLFLAI